MYLCSKQKYYSQTPLFRGFRQEKFRPHKPRNREARQPLSPPMTEIYWSNLQYRPWKHLTTLQNTKICFHLLCKSILLFRIRIEDDRSVLKWLKTNDKLMQSKGTGRKFLVSENRETGGSRKRGCETLTLLVLVIVFTHGSNRGSDCMSAHERSWALMSTHHTWALMSAHEHSWVVSAHERSWWFWVSYCHQPYFMLPTCAPSDVD